MDFYGIVSEKEVSMIIIKDKKMTKINWIEKH